MFYLKKICFSGGSYCKSYGIYSIRYQAVDIWKIQNNIASKLIELRRLKVKYTVIEQFLKSYYKYEWTWKIWNRTLDLHDLIEYFTKIFSSSLFRNPFFCCSFWQSPTSSPPYSLFTCLPFLLRIAIWLWLQNVTLILIY